LKDFSQDKEVSWWKIELFFFYYFGQLMPLEVGFWFLEVVGFIYW